MVEVEVTFDYDAEQEDELTIHVGDVIKNVVKSEGGWWEGELNGKTGMFPDNFVKVREKNTEESPKIDSNKTSKNSVRELANKIKENVHVGGSTLAPKKEIAKKKKAKVLFDYNPENEDEIKIEVGDVVEVLQQAEEGWWEGSVNGKKGMFPSNFVEEIDDEEAEKLEKAAADKKKDAPPEAKKKVMGVGLGNIFEGGPIKLRTTGALSKPESKETKTEDAPPVEHRTKTSIREKALVRYSYTADNDDELTLKEGDILTVLDKNLEDAGWWKGELNGSVGVFPDNFVEIIPSEESTVNALSKTHNKIPPQPKPKKPPPPGNNKHTAKPPPELPLEKPKLPPTTDITQKSAKTDRHLPPEPNNLDKPALPKKKEVLPEKPVSMSSKRPVVPPPIGSKPSAKQEARMSASLVETKPFDIPKNFKKEPEAAESLDAVESTDRLTHITASRAKGPSKRPPSNTQTNHNTEDLFQADMKENMSKSIHLLKETNEVPHNVNTPPSRPPEPSPATTKLLTIVEELKKEISDIKANTVSKSVYEDLKQETQRLREELDSLKTKQSKQYRSLFDEIDEEKRIRLNTQVDVERIRKLVSESHV